LLFWTEGITVSFFANLWARSSSSMINPNAGFLVGQLYAAVEHTVNAKHMVNWY